MLYRIIIPVNRLGNLKSHRKVDVLERQLILTHIIVRIKMILTHPLLSLDC